MLEPGECVLTFDDGPVLPATAAVLDALAESDVRAVFFVVGYNAARLPRLMARMVDAGHTVGTHTDIHLHLADVSLDEQFDQVIAGFEAVADAVGPGAVAPFFRFPFLAETEDLRTSLTRAGVTVWDADADGADWRGITVSGLVERAVAGLRRRSGGVLLLHDVQPVTALALPALIAAIDDAGFRIVHVAPSPGWRIERLREVRIGTLP